MFCKIDIDYSNHFLIDVNFEELNSIDVILLSDCMPLVHMMYGQLILEDLCTKLLSPYFGGHFLQVVAPGCPVPAPPSDDTLVRSRVWCGQWSRGPVRHADGFPGLTEVYTSQQF